MPLIKARDGTEIYVKDWGDAGAPPVVLIHGYPLNADSFDKLAIKLVEAGHRVLNYDRRGFGRSGQPWGGYDWDTYADDLADGCCQTKRNLSPLGRKLPYPEVAQAARVRHSARAAERRSL